MGLAVLPPMQICSLEKTPTGSPLFMFMAISTTTYTAWGWPQELQGASVRSSNQGRVFVLKCCVALDGISFLESDSGPEDRKWCPGSAEGQRPAAHRRPTSASIQL